VPSPPGRGSALVVTFLYSGRVSSAERPLADQRGLTADALLAGPRGRSLCVNLLGITGPPGTPFDASALLAGLQAAVDSARYWQEPDAEDQEFAGEAAREALRPVAEAVVAAAGAPEVRWWTAPVDRGRQRYVQFLGEHPLPEPTPAGAAESAAAWRANTLKDERSAHDRPEDPAASYSGRWWSSPALSGLPVTTRALPALGAVGLALTEDGLGWQSARCWPAGADDGARVYEIRGPDQWAELVDRYPLDVSTSRRHDWWRVTGWAGRWLIPDYAAVAADWDAVHVTVTGYLTTAGVAIPAGDGARTMLAGWGPDATWWLTDVLSFTSPPEDWRKDDQAPLGWTQAPQLEGFR
jgi:hypothetical protein